MTTYTTVQGDMWDSIAHQQLGDVKYTDDLINANLEYRDVYVFESGVVLNIPDLNKIEVKSTLPPWRRSSG